jgi:hypothetical protein
LAECDPGEKIDRLVDRLRDRNHPEWTIAAQVVEAIMRSQKAMNVAELRGWARKVGRFLLSGPGGERSTGRGSIRTPGTHVPDSATPQTNE